MRLSTVLAFIAASLVSVASAAAQAWVNPQGQLSLSVRSDYQTAQGVWHGSELVSGIPAQAVNSSISAEYVPIDKLSFLLTLSANGARYSGPQVIPGNSTIILNHGSQDGGDWNWNLTDLELETRYQAYEGPVTISPVLRLRTPITDYENKGYAAAGSGLREAGLGFSLGRYGLGLEDLVFQLGYQFSFVQKETGGMAATEQFRTNRSDVDLSFAYLISDKFVAAVGGALRWTHDGFDLTDYPALPAGDPLIMWHDPVLRARFFAPTVVASYQVSDAWSVSGRFAAIVWGENASNAITFGLSLGWANSLAE